MCDKNCQKCVSTSATFKLEHAEFTKTVCRHCGGTSFFVGRRDNCSDCPNNGIEPTVDKEKGYIYKTELDEDEERTEVIDQGECAALEAAGGEGCLVAVCTACGKLGENIYIATW